MALDLVLPQPQQLPAEHDTSSPRTKSIPTSPVADEFIAISHSSKALDSFRVSHPDLKISGNVISVSFTSPFELQYQEGKDWIISSRSGHTALKDAFAYLSSNSSSWNHTVVAWTGEIAPSEGNSDPASRSLTPLNALSAPIPFDGDDSADAASKPPVTPPSDGLWIPHSDRTHLEDQLCRENRLRVVPVWLVDEAQSLSSSPPTDSGSTSTECGISLGDQGRWRRYAEHCLHSLFHYKQHLPHDDRAERPQWADYFRLNKLFAERVAELYRPGDMIVVHDFPLMLLPSMLRHLLPAAYIAFFLHSPFPSCELLRCLPRRKDILEGVLKSNLIGFQSHDFARHFASCCIRILHFPSDPESVEAYGMRVKIVVLPIGLNAARVEELAWKPAVTEKVIALREMYGDAKVIVGRDRLDSASGIAQKLGAFERFLELYPEWRGRVILVQITTQKMFEPEKEDPERRVSTNINEIAIRINGAYGTLTFAPVQLYPRYLVQDEYLALLRVADVGLITTVREGINMTSFEYIICQKESHGPLVLSEFSGTASSLHDAVLINPWDLTGTADQINAALAMDPVSRRDMHRRLYQHVTKYDCQDWAGRLLGHLAQVISCIKMPHTAELDRSLLLQTYRASASSSPPGPSSSSCVSRLFLFDYDGTLSPIVSDPQAAIPSDRVLRGLTALAADERNAVWIISGRDQDFLTQHLGHIPGIGFSAEHGSFMREPGTQTWANLTSDLDMSWKKEVMEVFQRATDSVPGSNIECKQCAITWHYRKADNILGMEVAGKAKAELDNTVAKAYEIDVFEGKCTVEVRPASISKGNICRTVVARYNGKDAEAVKLIFCAGDDNTDEDMFRALNSLISPQLRAEIVFSTTVGPSTKSTNARWHVLEPEDVIQCILLLVADQASAKPDKQRFRGLSDVKLPAVDAVAAAGASGDQSLGQKA